MVRVPTTMSTVLLLQARTGTSVGWCVGVSFFLFSACYVQTFHMVVLFFIASPHLNASYFLYVSRRMKSAITISAFGRAIAA